MKLWNELTEEEQKALIDLAIQMYEIIDEGIVVPLVKLFNELEWFFTACVGIIEEEEFKKKNRQTPV